MSASPAARNAAGSATASRQNSAGAMERPTARAFARAPPPPRPREERIHTGVVEGRAMRLTTADYVVVAAFFAVNLGIGLAFARRGGTSVGEFFLSGRSVPWWLAGTSMVATTFAVDTPLAVTGFVAQHGIAGNWV